MAIALNEKVKGTSPAAADRTPEPLTRVSEPVDANEGADVPRRPRVVAAVIAAASLILARRVGVDTRVMDSSS